AAIREAEVALDLGALDPARTARGEVTGIAQLTTTQGNQAARLEQRAGTIVQTIAARAEIHAAVDPAMVHHRLVAATATDRELAVGCNGPVIGHQVIRAALDIDRKA